MDLTHTFTVPASVDETWAAFNDLESIAPCFPGAVLTSVDGDAFAGTVKVKLGPIALQYSGTGTFLERDEAAHRAVIEAKGKDKRGNGTAGAHVTAQLYPHDDGCRVEVTTELNVTGKPAQFGRGVMQDVSDKLLGKFVGCIAGKLGPDAAAADADAAPAAEPGTPGSGAPPPPASDPRDTASADPAAGAPPTGPTGTGARAGSGPRTAVSEETELDLGATVLPVLARRYGPGVLAVVLILLVLRRRRR